MAEQRRPGRYPAEMRDRAVRMVFEAEAYCGSQWEAICSIAAKLNVSTGTLRKWVREAETDTGARPGVSSADQERIRVLEQENRECCPSLASESPRPPIMPRCRARSRRVICVMRN